MEWRRGPPNRRGYQHRHIEMYKSLHPRLTLLTFPSQPLYLQGKSGRGIRGRQPSATVAAADVAGAPTPVVVWFKHDLRADDHPGLVQAAQSGSPIVALFCFDPKLYGPLAYLPGGAQGKI